MHKQNKVSVISSNINEDFHKATAVIHSCNKIEHIASASNYVRLFNQKHSVKNKYDQFLLPILMQTLDIRLMNKSKKLELYNRS